MVFSDRPKVHFTPAQNWINDPNGLVYYKGKYHLFYQHNPNGILWGDMSWGHSVSSDLLHWQHLPVALPFFPNAGIFSGSAVVDYTNSTGFGSVDNPAMVAIFTRHMNDNTNQSQCLAYSNDDGATWSYYDNNPVLDVQLADFRDPKVWRDHTNNRWMMVVVKPQEYKACFYTSLDLKSWTLLSEFGPAGSSEGCWECPDLFPLTTEDGTTKWVLIISINPGAPLGGSATQYFIGDWDGTTFTPDDTNNHWLDKGFDNYAGVTFNDTPDNRRIFIGWMSNWSYTNDYVKTGRLNAMTIPRELSLSKSDNSYQLIQKPISELTKTRYSIAFSSTNDSSIEIAEGEKKVVISYSPTNQELTVDRSLAWLEGHAAIAHTTHVESADVLLVLDRNSLELFCDGGATVITDLTLLDGGQPRSVGPATLRAL